MHKFFAKTLFLGKNIEFLTECHSTNDEMLQRAKFGGLKEGAILWTDFQKSGKGQRGNSWESKEGENLLFSLFLKPGFLRIAHQHYLTFIAALSIHDLLEELGVKEELIKIKWPNDVYVRDKKIAGILTEASIYQGLLDNTVVGIGLNVNQDSFTYSFATSIKKETNKIYDRSNLLEAVILRFEKYYLIVKAGNLTGVKQQYESKMYKKDELHRFRDADNEFEGKILGVDEKGWLKVQTNKEIRTFNFREIQFLR